MKYEYLLFNAVIFIIPFIQSFEKKVHFVSRWKYAFPATLIVLVPFIIWDALAAHRHWWFNDAYTMDVRLAGLPIGEWLFFITVPFACLFIWEILLTFVKPRKYSFISSIRFGLVLFLPLGLWVFAYGKEYTGLVMVALAVALVLDVLLKTEIFPDRRFQIFVLILIGIILIFNGYLTARPIVLYDPIYQLDFRITTIPVEDFFYGISHLFMVITTFEALKRRGTTA